MFKTVVPDWGKCTPFREFCLLVRVISVIWICNPSTYVVMGLQILFPHPVVSKKTHSNIKIKVENHWFRRSLLLKWFFKKRNSIFRSLWLPWKKTSKEIFEQTYQFKVQSQPIHTRAPKTFRRIKHSTQRNCSGWNWWSW